MHLIYVDESGDPGIAENSQYKIKETPSPYYIRTGLMIHDKKWQRINSSVKKFKEEHKIPEWIELHATEILNGKGPDRWFKKNFPNKPDRIQILLDACCLIKKLDVTLISVVLNKSDIYGKYTDQISELSWEYLIERINLYLSNSKDRLGMLISDTVQSGNFGGIEKKFRDFAKALYSQSMHVKEFHFVENILFEPSESSNLLQLADIAAYSMGRMFNAGDDVYYKIIENKLLTHNGCQLGYGLKFWP